MKKFLGFISLIFLSILLTACGNKVSVEDLKANDWQMDKEENKEDINFKVSFSDHIMTWAPDMSSVKSEASNEWEKMGEDFGKQIVENIKYKVEYKLKGTTIHLKEKDLNLDDDYSIEKDGNNIVLTPEDKDAQKLILKPYSKKAKSKEASTTSSTSKNKNVADLSKVIENFKNDGLEVNEPRKMTKDDYGMAPLKAKDGMIFGVQVGTDGEYQNARIFSFENVDDLNDTKKYYDDLGKESSMTFSYTAANEDKLVLMQFNGDLPKEVVDKYVDKADLTLTPVSFNTNSSSSQDTQDGNTNSSTATASPEQQTQQAAPQQDPAQQEQAAEQNDSSADTGTQYGTVQPGEGPKEVAGRYGMSVEDFLDANGMDADNYYFDPGQQVVVK
ncbi:LysM peptidoglycan-binding domain-containing protein [Enterococcus raffinosus]|uniref:LysM peptidoglycan-binding domain-containing protein n=1 Tax=Enterococcus raffinosus TaxID=71452 RepID=UPI000763FC06|nr:LysM peptidoglycan-binding domain-containing protein [Enterococcus raffinosus]MBX9039328.1 LysM peptidoglycan-binding domain-containing protein [Enterococcus raffinosus]